jgi:hypothetical protein
VVIDDDEDGEAEEERCSEWHDGVLSAESPADKAMCSSGTEGRESKVLCVCMNSLAISSQRDWL